MSKQTRNISQKTFGERIFHAVGFETIAVLISAPAAAWALNKPVWEMGALAIMLHVLGSLVLTIAGLLLTRSLL